jgi:hypothetical protein
MASVVVNGDTSGAVTLSAPAVAGTVTVTLPSASGTMAVLPTATGVLTEAAGGTGTTTGYYGFKNRLINSAMVIDQRNAGASVTPASFSYTLDRWQAVQTTASKFSVQQNAGAVTPPAGFNSYLGVTSLSAYSVAAGDTFNILQSVEGFNCSDLAWGTASAATVTLSFWVRSSLTGTFGGAIKDGSSTNSYPFTYTISSANTWEYKTITIVGPTSGQFSYTSTTNGIGLQVVFGLGAGATFSGTAGAWAAVNAYTATGSTSVVGTSGATFYVTGVQLEKGSTATSFDYRPIGTELALCQRYFEKSVNQGTSITKNAETSFFATVPSTTVANSVTYATQRYVATKRTAPTVLVYPYTTATNTTRISTDGGTDLAANSAFVNATSDAFFSIANTSGGTITTGAQLIFIGNWYASAEL